MSDLGVMLGKVPAERSILRSTPSSRREPTRTQADPFLVRVLVLEPAMGQEARRGAAA